MAGQLRGDFTRDTFDPFKHFSRVLMQQGRVQLDADWNEQAAILLHYLRALARDVIGPFGASGVAFSIAKVFDSSRKIVPFDFAIASGHCYVDGILCELNTGTTYATQADFPSADPLTITTALPNIYLAYLDVWERHICWAEDDSLLEVALGGPDTASRAKVVFQIRVTRQVPGIDITKLNAATATDQATQEQFRAGLGRPANRGWLMAQATPPSDSTNASPCITSPQAHYRGPECQLYRVEVHTGGTFSSNPGPTFKWSRENGSVIFPIVKTPVSSGTATPITTVQLGSLGRDCRFGLNVGDWVELVNDDYILMNMAVFLLQVQSIDVPSRTVTLAGKADSMFLPPPSKHLLLRRWDHKQADPATWGANNAILIQEATADPAGPWIDLEDGIQIQFQAAPAGQPGNQYFSGDYWLIPARTANGGEVEWPTDASNKPLAQRPHGITHHYAPLAIFTLGSDGPNFSTLIDCLPRIAPIAK